MLLSRMTYGHNSLVLNEHFNADGTIDNSKVKNTIVIDDRQSSPGFRDTRDPYQLATGGALGRVHKGMAIWRLRGRILVPDASQTASQSDRERAVRAAFDPELCYRDSPSTDGAYTLDWDETTTDTATWPTGRIPSRIYARPADQPEITEDIRDRTVRRLALALIAPDPRVYGPTLRSITLTQASPSQPVSHLGTATTPWRATITMSGVGSAAFGLDRLGDPPGPFQLDLSGMVNNDVVVVYGETCGPFGRGRRITKNGVDMFSLKVSAINTWFEITPGTQTITMTNHTNVASCVLAWHDAWV